MPGSRSTSQALRRQRHFTRGAMGRRSTAAGRIRAASCASRVLFLRDGEVSLELTRGKDTDAQFYQRIADALTQQQTGGECA